MSKKSAFTISKVSLALAIFFLLSNCGRKQEEQPVGSENSPANLAKEGDLFVVAGDEVYPFKLPWAPQQIGRSFYLPGIYDYVREDSLEIVSRFDLEETDKVGVPTICLGNFKTEYKVKVIDGEYQMSILLFQFIEQSTLRYQNTITSEIDYLSLNDNKVKLKTGFLGACSAKASDFKVWIGRFYRNAVELPECIPLLVHKGRIIEKFGKQEWEFIETEYPCLIASSIKHPEYICVGYDGLLSLTEDLGKEVVGTDVPFKFRLN